MASSAVTASVARVPVWIWSAVAAAAVAVLHLPSFVHRLMDGDEAVYGTIAALMDQGGRLYADGGVDNKPPGIYWLYAGTFDVFGRYQMTAIHTVELIAIAATCVVLVAIGSALSSRRAGVIAALLYGVLTAAGNPNLLAANAEVFMVLPLTGAFLMIIRRQWLWAASLMVAGGAFKQVAAVDVLLLPAGLMLLEARESRLRAVLWFGAGIGLGLAAGAIALALTGSIPGFWRWTIQTLVGYASQNWTPANLWSRAQESVLPFVLYGAASWIAALIFMMRRRTLAAAERLAMVWLGLSLVGSVAGGHWSWHYFIQVMAPLALVAGLGMEGVMNWRQPRRWLAAVALVGVAAPAVYWFNFDLRADPLTYNWTPPIAQHQAVGDYIAAHTRQGDRIFVWGVWPALYVESDRLMATRFPGFLRGFSRTSGLPPDNWDTAPDVWPALLSDLERNSPAVIVDTAAAGWSDFSRYPMTAFPLLAQYVARHYTKLATIDGVVVYARDS